MLDYIGVKSTISPRTLHAHFRDYVRPTVIGRYQRLEKELLDSLSVQSGTVLDEGICVSCDGKCDSPGHCAKFCGLTCIDCRTNKIIHVELVQVQ